MDFCSLTQPKDFDTAQWNLSSFRTVVNGPSKTSAAVLSVNTGLWFKAQTMAFSGASINVGIPVYPSWMVSIMGNP